MRCFLFLMMSVPAFADTEWPAYGNDAGGSRFAQVSEVTRDNVKSLHEVWRYRTGDNGEGYKNAGGRSFEATPILVNGVLYISTPFGQIHAIDAKTGDGVWHVDTQTPKERYYSEKTSRGVSYWAGSGEQAGEEAGNDACSKRIFFGTQDARMFALDAATGKPCEGFGTNGFVDLNQGTRPYEPGNYLITSPPAVYGDLVITGSAIGDNSAVTMELGIVRALDARTGEVKWSWDPIPRDESNPAYAEWQPDQVGKNSAANAWSVLSVDAELGIVYVPTGSASPDFYGGERLGSNRNANSVVALNALTGEIVWARQLVHHDIWDYDMPAQPVLVDIEKDGATLPSLVQITKMGMMFVLDRRTGEPVFPIEERPVPQSDVPGEQSWPTQPFSTLPPLVSHAPVTTDDVTGLMGFDWLSCRNQVGKYRSEGIYTPPSLEGTIEMPAYSGGGNWGSVSFDPTRQYAVTNLIHMPAVVQLLPRAEFDKQRKNPDYPDSQYTGQKGTPYGMRRQPLLSFLGVPCGSLPWGTLAAMDLNSGTIAWQVPLGTSEDLAPWPFNSIEGVPNIGGSIVTAGGLVFIGAALDNYLRAFDIDTGKELWKGRLPAGGQATPMSYEIGGKQFVVIAAGGHGGAGTTLGDYVVAFGL